MPTMAEGKKNKKQLNSAQLVKLLRDNIVKDEEVLSLSNKSTQCQDKG